MSKGKGYLANTAPGIPKPDLLELAKPESALQPEELELPVAGPPLNFSPLLGI
jgi:hypothetical protein